MITQLVARSVELSNNEIKRLAENGVTIARHGRKYREQLKMLPYQLGRRR